MEVLEHIEAAPVTFTQTAFEELMRLKGDLKLAEDQFLRIGVKGGGCSGLSYLLAFDKKEEQDKMYQYQGLDTCAVDGLCATACPVRTLSDLPDPPSRSRQQVPEC